jgi:dihydroflavonol-4-reductase
LQFSGYVGEFVADVFTHQPPAATVTGVALTRRHMHFDPRRSLEELGLRPRPVAETLAETVTWFREVGWLDERESRMRQSRSSLRWTNS